MKKCLLIISHGSRNPSANKDFFRLVLMYRKRHRDWDISYAFLEMAKPSIQEALESLCLKSNRIFILPLFLFAAKHVKKDIPKILNFFRKKHPEIKVRMASPLGSDSKLLEILDQRVREITN